MIQKEEIVMSNDVNKIKYNMHDFNDSPAQNHISKHTGTITKCTCMYK